MKKALSVVLATLLITLAAVVGAATRTVTLAVDNMTCAVCPITVKKALTRVDGVTRAEVSYEKREAVVTFDEAKTTVEALIQATTNAGYPASVKAK